jgi:hypothetical protein
MKKYSLVGLLVVTLVCVGLVPSSALAKEYKGQVSNGVKFNKTLRIEVVGNTAKVYAESKTATETDIDPKSFVSNPVGRPGAEMNFTYLPESDQYKVRFKLSPQTGGTTDPSFAEGVLSPQ